MTHKNARIAHRDQQFPPGDGRFIGESREDILQRSLRWGHGAAGGQRRRDEEMQVIRAND